MSSLFWSRKQEESEGSVLSKTEKHFLLCKSADFCGSSKNPCAELQCFKICPRAFPTILFILFLDLELLIKKQILHSIFISILQILIVFIQYME